MAGHRNLKVLLKVGWTEESGGVVYGGVQLHANPQLLPGIFQLMVHVVSQIMAHPQAAAENDEMIEMIRDGDMSFIRIVLPDDAAEGITESWGAHITHIFSRNADPFYVPVRAAPVESPEKLRIAVGARTIYFLYSEANGEERVFADYAIDQEVVAETLSSTVFTKGRNRLTDLTLQKLTLQGKTTLPQRSSIGRVRQWRLSPPLPLIRLRRRAV